MWTGPREDHGTHQRCIDFARSSARAIWSARIPDSPRPRPSGLASKSNWLLSRFATISGTPHDTGRAEPGRSRRAPRRPPSGAPGHRSSPPRPTRPKSTDLSVALPTKTLVARWAAAMCRTASWAAANSINCWGCGFKILGRKPEASEEGRSSCARDSSSMRLCPGTTPRRSPPCTSVGHSAPTDTMATAGFSLDDGTIHGAVRTRPRWCGFFDDQMRAVAPTRTRHGAPGARTLPWLGVAQEPPGMPSSAGQVIRSRRRGRMPALNAA